MCDWKGLQAQLAASPWIEPSDDLTTQRGIVATSIAVLERLREAGRTLETDTKLAQLLDSPTKPAGSPPSGGTPNVSSPQPQPRGPHPGGATADLRTSAARADDAAKTWEVEYASAAPRRPASAQIDF